MMRDKCINDSAGDFTLDINGNLNTNEIGVKLDVNALPALPSIDQANGFDTSVHPTDKVTSPFDLASE